MIPKVLGPRSGPQLSLPSTRQSTAKPAVLIVLRKYGCPGCRYHIYLRKR
jgi:hypothetical protein